MLDLKNISIKNNRYNSSNSRYTWILIILLFSTYLLLGIKYIDKAADPEAYDTTAYLGEANIIKNHGGVFNFLNMCISGEYKQANQHPLYILVLTPFASIHISFFIIAKVISFFIGLILLAFLFIIGKRMYGDLVASIAVLGLILNSVFLQWTTMVASESLLMLFSFLAIFFIFEGFNKNKTWLLAGAFAGLAYLSKGTGIFLLPPYFLAAVYVYRFKILKNKFFYLFFLAFIIVASPLFLRNIIVYKDPFFNVNKYIAEYSFDQIYNSKYTVFNPHEGTNQWKFEKIERPEKESNKPELPSYSIFNSLIRIVKDFGSHSRAFLYCMVIYQEHFTGYVLNIITSNSFSKSLWILILLILILFIIGILRGKNKGAEIYILTAILVFIFILSLFRPLTRYPLPLIPAFWIYTALGILTILELINEKIILKKFRINLMAFLPHLIILILVLNFIFIFRHRTLANPLKSVDYNNSRRELVYWLRANLKSEDQYTMGPNINWQLDRGTWILPPLRDREDLSNLISFIKRHNVNYLIMEMKSIIENGGTGKDPFFNEYFEITKSEGIIPKKDLKDFTLIYKDKYRPVDFLVFKYNPVK